jgi:ketosteroid isomerase-like protein
MHMQEEVLDCARDAVTRQLVEEYTQARIAMDYRRIAAVLDPDAVYEMPANPATSVYSGECRGRDNICELMRQCDAMLELRESRILDVLIDGERAAVRWSTLQRNRGTGDAVPVYGCAFITQRDGLITRYVNYVDTATINELAKQ